MGGVLADVGDVVAVIAGRRHLRPVNRILFAAAATSFAVFGLIQARRH